MNEPLTDPREMRKAVTHAAPRCSDYEPGPDGCATVPDHALCAGHPISIVRGVMYDPGPADGYCPFVCGMEQGMRGLP